MGLCANNCPSSGIVSSWELGILKIGISGSFITFLIRREWGQVLVVKIQTVCLHQTSVNWKRRNGWPEIFPSLGKIGVQEIMEDMVTCLECQRMKSCEIFLDFSLEKVRNIHLVQEEEAWGNGWGADSGFLTILQSWRRQPAWGEGKNKTITAEETMVKFCYDYFFSASSDVESCWRSITGILVRILLRKVETKIVERRDWRTWEAVKSSGGLFR